MPDSSIGKVQLDLETNYKPFEQQLNAISGKATGVVTNAFKSLGKTLAGAFAVTKLVQFGKASIDLASDLAEVQNVVDVVFGDANQQINNFAKNAITQYGLSELSAKQYASTMGAMLKSMGLTQEATLDMAQAITALTGDMASFYNLDTDVAFQKIRSGISGETEPLKQLGINMSVANMEAFALSQGITKSYQKMTQSEQALLRYNYLLKTTADAQGDFARTSDSWANQTRVLSEQFNTLKGTLGSAFIALLTPVVRVLNNIISKLQVAAAYFKAFVESALGIESESDGISSGMSNIADEATSAGDSVEKAAKKASNSLAGFDKLNVLSSSSGDSEGSGGGGSVPAFDIPSMKDAKIEFPEPDTSGFGRAIDTIKEKLKSLTKITGLDTLWDKFKISLGNVKGGVENLFQSFKNAIKNNAPELEEFKTSLENTFTTVSQTTTGIWGDMWVIVSEKFKTFTEENSLLLEEFFTNSINLWTEFGTNISDIVGDIFGSIDSWWQEDGKRIYGEIIDVFQDIITWVMKIYNECIAPIIDSIIAEGKRLWDNHLKPLWDNILGLISSVWDWIKLIWDECLKPIVNWVIEVLGPIITDVVTSIVNWIGDAIGLIIDVVSGLVRALKGFIDFLVGVFTGDWEKAWGGIKDFFGGIWDAIWGIVKGVINLIIDGLNMLWSGLYGVLRTIINGLGDVVGWIGELFGQDWSFSIPKNAPKIPRLARGGIIDQPTLAMVGEAGKEAVIPLENTAFADSIANAILRALTPLFASNKSGLGGSSNEAPTVFILKVGEYEFGRITIGAINKYQNAMGHVLLEV